MFTGQQYFGLQYYGECWGGEEADATYDKYGSNPGGCYNNMVGKAWHNFVYKFVSKYKLARNKLLSRSFSRLPS